MKATQLIVLAVAIAAAGGAGFIAMNMTAQPPAIVQEMVPQIARLQTDQVLVAIENIGDGVTITDPAKFRWQEWPKDSITDGYIVQSVQPDAPNELLGRLVRQTIFAGEPVRQSKLVEKGQSYMSTVLPAGYRAVATQISADTSAGGFILPNDRVDVIMTRRGAPNSGSPFSTEVILENIRVLAIDQTIREDEQGRLVQVGQTATLELTPDQTKIITVAQQMADRLTLALRSIEDVRKPTGPDATYLIGGDSGQGGSTLTIIKSGEISRVGTSK